MSTTPSVSCIQEVELHFMRYFLALKVGKTAMIRVFMWGYQGGHPISDYLLSRPGYSRRKFKNDFNQDQRRKLTSSTPADVSSYDISLLYILVQLTCGLADRTSPLWTTNGPSLENLLYRLKQLRNNIIHEEQCLTQQSLDTKLQELQELLITLYQSAAFRLGKNSVLVTQLCKEVSQQFVSIKEKIRETLQPADVAEMKQLQQEIQYFGDQIMLQVKQMGVKELSDHYHFLCLIDPAPWLRLNVKFKPSLAFTKLQIKDDNVVCGRPSQMKEARDVKCEEILRVTLKDGSTPDLIIMTGEGGIGKTTLLKYLIEKWVCDQSAVYDLEKVDIVLYTQCRESGIRSLDQLLKNLLEKTLQGSCVNLDFFRDTVLRLKTIILIDGYDEANKDSEVLVKDILQVAGKARVIVTTRPGSGDHLIRLIPSGKRCLDLLIKGIAPDLHSQYIDSMIDILVDKVDKRANIKESANAKLEDLKKNLEHHLNNPLTLTLLTVLWVECPEKFNAFTTVTDLYDKIRDLLIGKLVERLSGKVTDAEDKCQQFLTVHDDTALQSLKKFEFDLSKDTVATLRNTCNSLGLSQEDVLSSFFTKKRSRQGLKLVWIWSYLHRGFQEHGASRSIMKRLLAPSHEQGHTSQQLAAPDNNPPSIDKMLVDRSKDDPYIHEEVLFRLTGALASSDTHLSRYLPEILQLLPIVINYDGSALIETHLLLVLESKNHQIVIQEVAQKLSESRMWSTTGYHMKALPHVLSVTKPDNIKIEILLDTKLYPDLQKGLVALAKTTVNVQLHLTQHFAKGECVSDSFLRDITSNSCSLIEFSGRLSSPSLLPETLQWLWLRCSREELLTLASRLPALHLKHLDIYLELSGQPSLGSFPVLPFTGERLMMNVEARITDDQAEVDWCCDLMRQLCPHDREEGYETLIFHHTQLTYVGVERLARGLHRRGLGNISALYVRSCNKLTKKEEESLDILGKELGDIYLSVS